MIGGVRRIGLEERTEGTVTPGMVREQAIATDGMWAGYVRTAAAVVSGWDHHGAYETTMCVLSGGLRMEFGADGGRTIEAGPGDFVYVAPGSIHRESNPTEIDSRIVAVRAGTGEPVINVDGPEPGAGLIRPSGVSPGCAMPPARHRLRVAGTRRHPPRPEAVDRSPLLGSLTVSLSIELRADDAAIGHHRVTRRLPDLGLAAIRS